MSVPKYLRITPSRDVQRKRMLRRGIGLLLLGGALAGLALLRMWS